MDAVSTFELPLELHEHAARVRAHLASAVAAADGFLPFDAFMHEALYAPGLGYYAAGLKKFGADGDFVTAPEVSPLFGRVLARNAQPVLAALDSKTVVEYGPGSGALAESLIQWFAERELALDYRLVEVSADLVARQRSRLSGLASQPGIEVSWVSDVAAESIDGVIIANEVADALPVCRFRRTDDGVDEVGLVDSDDGLALAYRPARERVGVAINAIEAARGDRLPAGYSSEYSPGLASWVGAVAKTLRRGLWLVSDYGLSRRDYYSDERTDGTFLCHFRHRAHADALAFAGLQDMTAWVDFTALAEAGVAAGLTLVGYTTQSGFLVGGGLADECTGELAPAEQLAQAAALKTLTLPGEMGERFRFLGLARGTLPPVAGFGFRDLSYQL